MCQHRRVSVTQTDGQFKAHEPYCDTRDSLLLSPQLMARMLRHTGRQRPEGPRHLTPPSVRPSPNHFALKPRFALISSNTFHHSPLVAFKARLLMSAARPKHPSIHPSLISFKIKPSSTLLTLYARRHWRTCQLNLFSACCLFKSD